MLIKGSNEIKNSWGVDIIIFTALVKLKSVNF